MSNPLHESAAQNQALMECICAMKGGARLAQSPHLQGFENMVVLRDFSSPPEADSTARQKRDSQLYSTWAKARF